MKLPPDVVSKQYPKFPFQKFAQKAKWSPV